MTMQERRAHLLRLNGTSLDDELADLYLQMAGDAILSRAYPFDGTEVEQITPGQRSADAANIRQNTIFTRKYYLAALTDETKAVKITVGG